jgi:lysophospholipase L1-like esterase
MKSLFTVLLRRRTAFFLMSVACMCVSGSGQGIVPPAPQDRLKETWWADRHNAVLAQGKQHPDTQLLLIGDSITNNYDKSKVPDENFQPIWKEFYGRRGALNLGFSGDTTANVMWRIDHGEVDGLHPKAAVLLIGTNNTGHAKQSAEETESGLDALLGDLEQRLPGTRILLLGILPSDLSADKTEHDLEINRHLAACYGENPQVTYLDIGSIFFQNNELNTSIFYDPRLPHPGKALHPDSRGQRMMAEAIEPTLSKLMGDAPSYPLAAMTAVNTATIPVSRLEIDSYDWYARHHAELELQKQMKPDVVMLGDSITHFWGGLPNASPVNGPASWQRAFGHLSVINMGFGWDRTQNVLWRLRQGEFDGLSPRFIVLNIGTNNLVGTENTRASTPQEVAAGVAAICAELRKRSPQSRIVVMAIFPRGHAPDNPLRARIKATNEIMARQFAGASNLIFLDIGSKLLAPDGSLPREIMPDGTHPSDAGYQVWANALAEVGVKP